MGKNITYDAFISYRHKPLDLEVAKKLHKLLETYVAPKSSHIQNRKLTRVFRDQEELPTSSNLGENIYEALQNSRYLIVICSPDTPKSTWVQQEIETFIKLHGYDRILALLIDGEPHESFPEPLCMRKITVQNEIGELKEIREEVEPLAADIRCDTRKGRFKALEKEKLRLLAPILGCSFDDLRQRDKERRMQRLMALGSILIATLVLFGGYNAWQADRYQKQRNMTQEANVKLQEQMNITLQTESLFKSDLALEAIAEGDLLVGAYLALDALPEDMKKTNRPYVAEAEQALHEALHTYQSERNYKASQVISHPYKVLYTELTKDGNYLLTQQENGHVILWDRKTENKVWEKQLEKSFEEQVIYLLQDTVILYRDGDKLRKEALFTGEVAWEVTLPQYENTLVLDEKNNVIYVVGEYLSKYSVKDGTLLGSYSLEDDFGITDSVMKQRIDDNYMTLSTFENKVMVIDLEQLKVVFDVQVETDNIIEVEINKELDKLLIRSSHSNEKNILETTGQIEVYELEGQKKIYQQSNSTGYQYARFNPYNEEQLIVLSSTNIQLVNVNTQQIEKVFYTESKGKDIIIAEDLIIVGTEAGTIQVYLLENNEESYWLRISGSKPIQQLKKMKQGYYTLDPSRKHITFFEDVRDTSYKQFVGNQEKFEDNGSSTKGTVSKNGQWYAHGIEGLGISVWDMDTKEFQSFVSLEEAINYEVEELFFEEEWLYAISKQGKILKINPTNGEVITLDFKDEEISHIDREGGMVLLATWDKYYLIDLQTLTVKEEMQVQQGISDIVLSQGKVYLSNYEATYKVEEGTLKLIPGTELDTEMKKTEAGLVLYNEQMLQVVVEDSVVAAYESPYLMIESACLMPDGKHVAIQYDSYELVIRNIETNEEKIIDTSIVQSVEDAYLYSEDKRIHLVLGDNAILTLSENYTPLVYIEGVLAIDEANQQVVKRLGDGASTPLIYPYYTTQDLISKGRTFLEGKTITDIKQKTYLIK